MEKRSVASSPLPRAVVVPSALGGQSSSHAQTEKDTQSHQ